MRPSELEVIIFVPNALLGTSSGASPFNSIAASPLGSVCILQVRKVRLRKGPQNAGAAQW